MRENYPTGGLMQRICKLGLLSVALMLTLFAQAAAQEVDKPHTDDAVRPAPNGLDIPKDFENWAVISVSHRTDRKSMRVILGNDIAVRAARAGQTNPWPDGAIVAKVAWSAKQDELWPAAVVPDTFLIAEFMFKDSKRFASNGTGWGWARWVGPDRTPYGKDANFEKECIDCHAPAAEGRDWVFTHGAAMR